MAGPLKRCVELQEYVIPEAGFLQIRKDLGRKSCYPGSSYPGAA